MSSKKTGWLKYLIPLSLGAALSMGLSNKDKSQNDSIQGPDVAEKTTFTLDNNYDVDASVSIETNTSMTSCRKVMEHVYYDHGSGKRDQQSHTSSSCRSFFQSHGDSMGRKYSVWFLTDQQSQDRQRLSTIYNTLKGHTAGASVVRCEKPSGDKTLTCKVTPL